MHLSRTFRWGGGSGWKGRGNIVTFIEIGLDSPDARNAGRNPGIELGRYSRFFLSLNAPNPPHFGLD